MPFESFEAGSDARTAAAGAWNQYAAFVQKGFSPDQAMLLLCTIIDATITSNAPRGG